MKKKQNSEINVKNLISTVTINVAIKRGRKHGFIILGQSPNISNHKSK